MEGSFAPKRLFDPPSVDRSDPKRRHHAFSTAATVPSSFKPHPSAVKLSPGETLFRMLCPSTRIGGLIGKGGAIIRQFREETGAKIRIDESVHGCDERVVLIIADNSKKKKENSSGDGNNDGEDLGNLNSSEEEVSPAQLALVKVFERMLKVDGERLGVSAESEVGEEKDMAFNGGTVGSTQGSVVCRLLVPSNQVGCVLGKGGKVVEKIRQDSGAQIRVLPKDHIPACASPGDELIQITGNFSAVKKALVSVSSCLQDNPRTDAPNSTPTKPLGTTSMSTQPDPFPQRSYVSGLNTMDYHSRGYSSAPGSENIGTGHRNVQEEEVVFKLLCQLDKVGSLIGKGGVIIQALQSETGASIKIADAAPDSDERVVMISARENLEQKHSPAQDAVLRVHSRIAEIGLEPGASVVARLLVPSNLIGCLLGKGGSIIAEMRRATGASIRIFAKDQLSIYGAHNDDIVQVIGSLQSVQDALFNITSRLRETVFPMKPSLQNIGAPTHFPAVSEIPSPLLRSRQYPSSPGNYPSPVGHPHGFDRSSALLHGSDHIGTPNAGQVPHPYGGGSLGHIPTFERQSPPSSWPPQGVSSVNHRGVTDMGTGFASRNGLIRSGNQAPVATSTTVEVVVPQTLLCHVYGENNTNLSHIRQISGASVAIQDPRLGETEGIVIVSGTSDQNRAAQSLIQAFILCGQTSP